MRDIAIRYMEMPGFVNKDMYRVYVPVRGELVPFNFFDKVAAFKFAENLVDGEFTDEEVENLLRAPMVPGKPKRSRPARQDSIPLSERDPDAWTSPRRYRVVYEALEGGRWVSSAEAHRAGRDAGDKTSQGTYHSILRRLEKLGKVKVDGSATPMRFQVRPDVAFDDVHPVETPRVTHSKARKLAALRAEKELA